MGDFNAKDGKEQEMSGCMGLSKRSRKGYKLGKFCLKHNLKIVNIVLFLTPQMANSGPGDPQTGSPKMK